MIMIETNMLYMYNQNGEEKSLVVAQWPKLSEIQKKKTIRFTYI